MDKRENVRLILGLRAKGWTDIEINDLVRWIETGSEKYDPEKQEEKPHEERK